MDEINNQNIEYYRLGYCYENGEGVGKDFKTAVYYYKLAANQDIQKHKLI